MNIFKGTSYNSAPTGELKKYQFFDFEDFCEKGLKKCSAGSKFESYITIGDEYKITKGDPNAHIKSYKNKDHFHRNNPSQISAGMIPFDGDNSKNKAGCCIEPKLVHQALKEANLTHCIYTTHSHRTKEHPDKIRWRLFLPCNMKEASQLAPSITALFNLIAKNGCEDLAMATESKTWSVPWFLPTRDDPDDGKFEFYSYYEGNNFEASDAESIISETIISDDKISMDDMVLTIMNGVPDTGVHIAITKYIHGQKKDGVTKATVLANLKAFIHNWPYDDYHKRYYNDMIRDLNITYGKKDKEVLIGDYEKTIFTTTDDFDKIKLPDELIYLSPWFVENKITLISGIAGCGKSWFVFSLLGAIANSTKMGVWEGINSVPVLYVDGEMGVRTIQKRLRFLKLNKKLKSPLYILNNDLVSDEGGIPATLVNEEYREFLMKKMLVDGIKVVAFDNVSCLTPGLEENSKKDWDVINQWLIKLKHNGISTILIHHLGKDGKRGRGTSGRFDNINFDIVLRKPAKYNQARDGARFTTDFEKHREVVGKNLAHMSDWKLTEKGWEVKDTKSNNKKQIAKLFHEGWTGKDIAKELEVTPGYVTQVKNEFIDTGLMDKKTKKLIGAESIKNILNFDN